MNPAQSIKSVRQWVETVVVGLNLCPFAKAELGNDRIRFHVTETDSSDQLVRTLTSEIELLRNDRTIETTLLIHPFALKDFRDYNQFLGVVNEVLVDLDLEGVFQIASFHPDYQFAGTDATDVENYTNRSPCPMLHILREESLEKAIAQYPDTEQIPGRNIERVNNLGLSKMQALLRACIEK